jgi:magnesium transporter
MAPGNKRPAQGPVGESLHLPSQKAGLPPGSLVHVGNIHVETPRVSVIRYGKHAMTEIEIEAGIESLAEYLLHDSSDQVSWVIVEGLADVAVVEKIGELFDIHQLVLEDILNTHQRPKFEDYEDYLFIVLKGLMKQGERFAVDYEQISLVVMPRVVLTFKEKKDDLFAPLLQRLRASKGRFRSLGTDYLTYSILDAIIDQKFALIDSLDEAITELEDQLLAGQPGTSTLNGIQYLKREVIKIRRYVSPVRELISDMLRSESALIDEKTHIYLRDLSDHAIRIIESIELHRDIISSLLEIYVSSLNNKMNEVMKVLTVFASIFIPLTFLTGIYGMNFEYMPELSWHWAYPLLWLAFITIPVVLLLFFKRKHWL